MAKITYVGDRNNPPVLLLHGAGLNREMWGPQLEGLNDECYLIAPDLPGHGDRSNEPFSIEAAVSVAAEALENQTPAFTVGLSLGGYVAIRLAEAYPRYLNGLVLSGASVDYSGWAGIVSWPQFVILEAFGRYKSFQQAYQWIRRLSGRTPAIPEKYASMIDQGGVSLQAWGRSGRLLCFQDFRSPLETYAGPLLLVNGERDRPNRYFEDDIVSVVENCEVQVVAGAGHAVNLEQPEAFNTAVRRFVSEHST